MAKAVVCRERFPRQSTKSPRCCTSGITFVPDEPDDFTIRDMSEILKTLGSMSQMMGMLLMIVAMISLVVGGVGIMNIMLVSVTERTKEIGLRMAVGARGHQILRQFLIEAVVLCLMGGAVGIVLGRWTAMLVRYFLHWPVTVSYPAIIWRGRCLGDNRHRVRFLSRLEGLAARPDRCAAIRVAWQR